MSRRDLHKRASGILLHPTSLPGPHGSGDLGPEAHRFAEQLATAGQSWWQMLPVGPVGFGNSPYSAHSAFAGSPLLISLDFLARDGLLRPADLAGPGHFAESRVDYPAAKIFREVNLRQAFTAFQSLPAGSGVRREQEEFAASAQAWLDDFALYSALKRAHGQTAWTHWEPELRDRLPHALARARQRLADDVAFHCFEQWTFSRQWRLLREHCHRVGVGLLGDLPIFVAHDSADVWAHREFFKLDDDGQPSVIAGVPPDYFSATGQRWGNPLYRWDVLRDQGYAWWLDRLRQTLERFDAIRLDHFIGFHRAWEIPAHSPTAMIGEWVGGPGAEFFEAATRALGPLPFIAEDLGVVTPEVKALRDRFDFPGMRILQFAFGDDPSAPDFLPHVYPRRTVVYTGTHDNDTTVGWFHDPGDCGTRTPEQTERERRATLDYLGSSGAEIHWEMIRMALLSVAGLAVVPVQDVLGLGTEARMNHPGTVVGNWEWRLAPDAPLEAAFERLAHLTRLYGRAPRSPGSHEEAKRDADP